ncbi:MAG: hypothetical protein LUG99_09145 [Lachnospiraceae bacterium]|nr:hypothetical protein [Lachnospiraceae bacterium]
MGLIYEAEEPRICPQCLKEFEMNHKGRPKIFCSESCRKKWKNRHPNPANWSSTRVAVCPQCRKEFLASRETPKPRKYCSHACANRARAHKPKGDGKDGKGAADETNS